MEGSYTMTEQSEDYARDLKQGKASWFYPPMIMTKEEFKRWLDEAFWY
jgi:hypothetical protein